MRQLTWKNTSNGRGATAIKDSTGNLITEPEEIRKRWKNYIEMLYDKKGKPLQDQMQVEDESIVQEDFKGPGLLN